MNWETYIALGDSITFGARTYLSYPEKIGQRLKQELNKDWNVINISQNGFRVIDLIRLLDKNYASLGASQAGVTSILIGTNDVKSGTPESDFRLAYDLLVLKAKLFTQNKNVILLQIPEFPKGIMYPYNYEMNETVRRFNTIIKELAAAHRLRTFAFSLEETDFTDGVHLSDQGVENCSVQLGKFILKDKGI